MTKKKIIETLQTPRAVRWFWILIISPIALILILLFLIRIGVFGKLPTFEELENPKSNLATEIYSQDGEMIGSFFVQNRSYVDYEELSPALIAALVSTEDVRFYSHSGIDFISLEVRLRSSWPKTSIREIRRSTIIPFRKPPNW